VLSCESPSHRVPPPPGYVVMMRLTQFPSRGLKSWKNGVDSLSLGHRLPGGKLALSTDPIYVTGGKGKAWVVTVVVRLRVGYIIP
jgi:hypothetical protein